MRNWGHSTDCYALGMDFCKFQKMKDFAKEILMVDLVRYVSQTMRYRLVNSHRNELFLVIYHSYNHLYVSIQTEGAQKTLLVINKMGLFKLKPGCVKLFRASSWLWRYIAGL